MPDDAPIEKIVTAVQDQAEAEAEAAEAVTEQKTTQAVQSVVAAAEGAAALAQVEAARATLSAEETITQAEERLCLLGTQTENLSAGLQNLSQQTEARLSALQQENQKLSEAMALLISAQSTPKETIPAEGADIAAAEKNADAAAQKEAQKKKRTIRLI